MAAPTPGLVVTRLERGGGEVPVVQPSYLERIGMVIGPVVGLCSALNAGVTRSGTILASKTVVDRPIRRHVHALSAALITSREPGRCARTLKTPTGPRCARPERSLQDHGLPRTRTDAIPAA